MDSRLSVIDANGEAGDLSQIDSNVFKPFTELPATLQAKLSASGKQTAPVQVSTPMRLDADVLTAFKATGRGCQTHVNKALKEWLREYAT